VRKVYLIRHAKAEKLSAWDGPEPLRPLTPRGLLQAQELAESLAGAGVRRILASPFLRCRQTAAPLAARLGLRVLVDERLADGEPVAKALELLRQQNAAVVACFSHRALHAELADELAELDVEAELVDRTAPEGEELPAHRLAVIDLGSTSFHLLVADATAAGRLTPVHSERVMLRLGAALASGRRIPDAAARRAVEAALGLGEAARREGAERIVAVGTAALREAANGAALTRAIGRALGLPVRLLTGEEEARLIFSAFRRRVWMPRGRVLGADLGGGSLELAVGDTHDVFFEATLALGVARLHSEIVRSDPMTAEEASAVRKRVHALLAPKLRPVAAQAPVACVAAGGTARALGWLVTGLRGLRPARSVNHLEIPLEELRDVSARLVRSSHAERLRMPGIRRRRADLLPTGALVLLAAAEMLELDGYTLSDWGLREGVLLEALGAA
jgi:exopolyphosphatase/guanosine-5'-triphosphate,3'-diphosphate pyrophosphatase